MKPRINAIYISVQNMERAVKFYEEIFDKGVSLSDKEMSSFDFDNISFLLYNPDVNDEKILFGNNVIPNIEVENIKKMQKLVTEKGCKIVMPLEKIGKYLIFQMEDTEGNIIEFYQTVK